MKKIMSVLFFIMLVMFQCIVVYAAELTEETTEEITTGVQSGYFNCHAIDASGAVYVNNVNMTITKVDGSGKSGLFVGHYYEGSMHVYRMYCVGSASGTYSEKRASSESSETFDYVNNGYSEISGNLTSVGSSLGIINIWDDWTFSYDTNIPIFAIEDKENPLATEAISNYIENGDTSGADNADEYIEYSDNVQLPQNFKIVDGYKYFLTNKILFKFEKDVVMSWNQSVDTTDYKYDIDVSFSYQGNLYSEYVGNKISLNGDVKLNSEYEVTTPFISYSVDNLYSGSKNITSVVSAKTLNDMLYDYAKNNKHCDLDDSMTIRKIVLRVRNKEGQNCSNYVSATINFSDKSVSTSETDENGNTVEDAEYDNDDGTISKDEQESGTSANVSLDGVMSFIRNGFGLLGNGGIIALLSSTFLYLPNSIWTMLKFLVAMMIATCVIKLVKDVVT